MRAIFAAIARAMRGLLGILWAPIEWVGGMCAGFGGGSASPQDDAAAVASRAAQDEEAKALDATAGKSPAMDDAATIKRVAGRLLLGKQIALGTRISADILVALTGCPKRLLKKLSEGTPELITGFIDGYRGEIARKSGIPPVVAEAPMPKVAARIAARRAAESPQEVSAAWMGYQNDWMRSA